MSKPKYIKWDKCIHIHACRRYAKIIERKTGKPISRGCGEDCEAFEERSVDIGKAAQIVCNMCDYQRWLDTEARGDDVECYQRHIRDGLNELAEMFDVSLHNHRLFDYDRWAEYNDPIYDSPLVDGYKSRVKIYNKEPRP